MRFMKRYAKPFLLIMMLMSWISLFLFGKRDIKRFSPAGVLMLILVTLEDIFAQKQKWWEWKVKLIPNLSGIIPFLFGPFFIGSLWILKYSYGHFIRYIVLNLIVDSLTTYFIAGWFKKLKIGGLVRLKEYQLSLLFFLKSLLLYGFQSLIDKVRNVKSV